MTDASIPIWPQSRVAPSAKAEARVDVPPVAFSAPVLIGDCVTPLGGETLLSIMWKRLDQDG